MKRSLSKYSNMVAQLNQLRIAGWDAIIAGGAIRDTYHDKPISDIDIFMSINPYIAGSVDSKNFASAKWAEYWKKVFHLNPKKNDTIKCFGDFYAFEDLNNSIKAVWEIKKSLKTYQLIILDKDPRDYVNDNFDLGICRAYCDGVKMSFTNDFLKDSLNHTITLYKEHLTKPQIEYALKYHIDKVKGKYPGWSVVLDG